MSQSEQSARLVLPIPPSTLGAPPSALARWLTQSGGASHTHHRTHHWSRVLWLTGVDYFSTLGYQPGIALLAAGALSPLATVLLVGVTLFGALPTYAQVARRSFAGQGSIAMLEDLLPGWIGKIAVLSLLGFAATDFVITVTLSSADAAKHAIENPLLHSFLGDHPLGFTLVLLIALAVVFLRGFREAIGVAMAVGIPYLVLNFIVLVRAGIEIARRPEVISSWSADLAIHGDWTFALLAAGIAFPHLALGMSGFETGVTVMPLVDGGEKDRGRPIPAGRIRATRKLLVAAALTMSVFLLASSLATTLLIPPEAYHDGGPAAGRAIAFLAHQMLGQEFGTLFDLSTIAILWFAGASATAGMLHLIPRYLPRFGMAPDWVAHPRPLVLILLAIEVVVTLAFRADVEAQAGAYATGVLVLMLSAAVAVALAFAREQRILRARGTAPFARRAAATFAFVYFVGVSVVFGYTLTDNVIFRPDGLVIASLFIGAILVLSALSRFLRVTELRVEEITFADEESQRLWPEITGKKLDLAPLKDWSEEDLSRKAREIRRYAAAKGPIGFLHVRLVDDRSEFLANLRVRVRRRESDFTIEVSGAVAVANTIASISELIDPKTLFLGLARQNLMRQAFTYVFWGEGEIGILVYTILLKHWASTPEDDVRPLIFLVSE